MTPLDRTRERVGRAERRERARQGGREDGRRRWRERQRRTGGEQKGKMRWERGKKGERGPKGTISSTRTTIPGVRITVAAKLPSDEFPDKQ